MGKLILKIFHFTNPYHRIQTSVCHIHYRKGPGNLLIINWNISNDVINDDCPVKYIQSCLQQEYPAFIIDFNSSTKFVQFFVDN